MNKDLIKTAKGEARGDRKEKKKKKEKKKGI